MTITQFKFYLLRLWIVCVLDFCPHPNIVSLMEFSLWFS